MLRPGHSPAYPVLHAVEAFNSLFEMRNVFAAAWLWAKPPAFNSLFEMRYGSRVTITRNNLPSFNSLFEMPARRNPFAMCYYGRLSILYLRCGATLHAGLVRRLAPSFQFSI